jgi:hypothetical protein
MRNLCKRSCIPLEGVAFNSLSTTSVNYSVLVFWKRTTLSFPTIKSINQLIIQTFCVEQRASRMLMHTKNESARTLIKNNLPLKSGFYRLPQNSNRLPRNSNRLPRNSNRLRNRHRITFSCSIRLAVPIATEAAECGGASPNSVFSDESVEIARLQAYYLKNRKLVIWWFGTCWGLKSDDFLSRCDGWACLSPSHLTHP